jgi:hypothetical protein
MNSSRQSGEFRNNHVFRAGRNRLNPAAIYIYRLVDCPRVPISRKTRCVFVYTIDVEAALPMKA